MYSDIIFLFEFLRFHFFIFPRVTVEINVKKSAVGLVRGKQANPIGISQTNLFLLWKSEFKGFPNMIIIIQS